MAISSTTKSLIAVIFLCSVITVVHILSVSKTSSFGLEQENTKPVIASPTTLKPKEELPSVESHSVLTSIPITTSTVPAEETKIEDLVDVSEKSGLDAGEVDAFVDKFIGSIEDSDLNVIAKLELDPQKDRMAVAMEKFYQSNMSDCKIVHDTVAPNYKGVMPDGKFEILQQYVELPVFTQPDENAETLIRRLYTTFFDNDGTIEERRAQVRMFARFRHREWAAMGWRWVARRIPEISSKMNSDETIFSCFATTILRREKLKLTQNLVEEPGQESRREIIAACGATDVSNNLQILADMLMRPLRVSYITFGEAQLRHFIDGKTRARQLEFEKVLNWNLCHPFVAKIHLITHDTDINLENLPARHKDKIELVKGMPKVMHYSHAIQYCNGQKDGTIFMITNSDVMLGEGWEGVREMVQPRVAFALSRFEAITSRLSRSECCSDKYTGCHDAFVFAAPLPAKLVDMTNFQQNIWTAENAMINQFCTVGLRVINPCYDFRMYHYHYSNFRPNQNNGRATHNIHSRLCNPSFANQFQFCC